MSRSLRYDDPELCELLAAQYVAGDMTPRVRRRMEALLSDHAELRAAVGRWSDRLMPLQHRYPERTPPARLWSRIEQGLDRMNPAQAATEPKSNSAWSRLGRMLDAWRLTALGGVAATVALAVSLMLVLSQPSGPVGADYMAPLSWNGEVAMVVSGYRGSEDRPAWLSAQWSDRLASRPEGDLHLWAETGEDREWVYLGPVTAENRRWSLDKEAWRAVKYSHRLVVNTDSATITPQLALLEGPCIRLTQW
ncbi:anti-sigma factor [Saccharospirillum salsuginis]|uniref:Anti-sigma factor n=1 Tax=Saccharospirillum salsuginis TaxID=418750 RepID=A0A918KA76_9GAMM|nr:hypothetical protein [Saccharospirillum salsuginis]GGX55022.1 hypothetical protein GCM10007392_23230 [Saccharospirillum salsuginis]